MRKTTSRSPVTPVLLGFLTALGGMLGVPPAQAIPVDSGTLRTPASAAASGSGEAQYNAGIRALAADRLDEAEKAFQSCLDLAPRSADCMLGVATVASARGNPSRAAAWIERAVSAEPNNPYALASLGRLRAVDGRTDEAIAALERAARLDAKAVRPRVDLGDIYLTTKTDPKRAAELYRSVLDIEPDHAGARFALGAALTRLGDSKGAAEAFSRASELAPGNPLPAIELSRLYAASGNLTEAERYAREAVKLQPGLLQARLTLGQVLEASGRSDEALKEYRAMAAAHPKLAAPDFHVGAALHALGDLAGAAAAYGRALEKDPEFGPALNNLAAIELGRKANDKAEALAQRAVNAAPQNAAFRDTHAEVLAAGGDLRGAAGEQQQAVKLEPGNPAYLARLGLLQARLGQKDEARKSLSRALGMSQQFPGAAEARKALESLPR